MAYEGKTYTIEEMDEMMKKHIAENAQILRKNLSEKRKTHETIHA